MTQEQYPIPLPRWIMQIMEAFRTHNFQCYVVGGTVRDALLGRAIVDYDLATDATPRQMQKIWRRTIPTGAAYGTVTLCEGARHAEVTTFRSEKRYDDNRHPTEIQFGTDLHTDLHRRDFTINALAYNPWTEELTDLFDGTRDIHTRTIRTVGDPRARFGEDALRILRAIRFATVLAFDIEQETARALTECGQQIQHISKERIREEMERIIQSPYCPQGFNLLARHQLLPTLFHVASIGARFMEADNLTLSASIKEYLTHANRLPAHPSYLRHVLLWYGHILHTRRDKKGGVTHRDIQEQLAVLRYARHHIRATIHLLSMLLHLPPLQYSPTEARYFFCAVGGAHVKEMIQLIKELPDASHPQAYTEGLIEIATDQRVFDYSDLAINGHDLKKFGYHSGKLIGTFMDAAIKYLCTHPHKNTPHSLREYAHSFLQDHQSQNI